MLTIQDKSRIVALWTQLSPENLCCDGELTRAQTERRRKAIMKEWRELEAKAGFKFTDALLMQYSDEADAHFKAEQARIMAAEPQHPLLTQRKPGVWVREGRKDGDHVWSAYYIWGPSHSGSDFQLFSEFAHRFGRPYGLREKLGNYPTLEAAVEAGEYFLKGVCVGFILKGSPLYRAENVVRELNRLPEGYYVPSVAEVQEIIDRAAEGA